MVASSSNVQFHLQSFAQIYGRHVWHQNESHNSTLYVTSPRCKCTEHRCIEHLLGGSGRLSLFCRSHSKNEHVQVQNDCSGPSLAPNALVLGSNHLLSQIYHQNLLYLNLHVWHLDTTHLNHFLSRWQRELRHLKDPHLNLLGLSELWCQQNKVVSSEPTILNIPDFLNHLFNIKNLGRYS